MKVNLERGVIATGPAPTATTPAQDEGEDFTAALLGAIDKIDGVAKEADSAAEGLVTGEVDLHEAMVSMEKADLALKLGTTIRNKLLDAYQQLLQSGG